MQLTEEQAVRIGLEFRRLTNSEHFETVVESLMATYQNKIRYSTFSERDVRERTYAQMKALEDLIMTINTFIAMAEADALEVAFDEELLFD